MPNLRRRCVLAIAVLSHRFLLIDSFITHHRGLARPTSWRFLGAKPKRGSIVDTYQTVSVRCAKCTEKLFRYKKKNGTKSGLVKCYVERIAEDSAHVLRDQYTNNDETQELTCPACQTRFARSTTIKGLPALKLVGGKVRMTKK